MIKVSFTSLISAFLFISLPQTGLADTMLSGDQIREVISGNTAVGGRQKTKTQELMTRNVLTQTYFQSDMKLVEKGLDAPGSTFPAHGTWRIKKDKLCMTFIDSHRNAGEEMCYMVNQKDDGTYDLIRKDKVKRMWREIKPGNPYNLK